MEIKGQADLLQGKSIYMSVRLGGCLRGNCGLMTANGRSEKL